MSRINVGVIGLGIGWYHLRSYKEIKDVNVAAIVDIDKEALNRVGDEYGIKKRFTDYKKMLKLKEIDAVSVCTPNYLHAQHVLDTLNAGKHVLCEKPLANTVANGKKIVEAVKKQKKVFMLALNNRYRIDTNYIKSLIDNGELGDIYFGKAGWIRRKGIPGLGGWFTQKAKAGGGPVIDIGVHAFDLIWWLMGRPEPVSVSSAIYDNIEPKDDFLADWSTPVKNGKHDVEDFGAAFMRFKNGSSLFLEASWASHIKQETMYLGLQGTKGGISLKPFEFYKHMNGQAVNIQIEDQENVFKKKESLTIEIEHFLDCIKNDKQPLTSIDDGFTVLKILDMIYSSGEKGKEVYFK